MDQVPSSGHHLHLFRLKSFVFTKLGQGPAQFQGAIFYPRSESQTKGLSLHPFSPCFPADMWGCDPTGQLKPPRGRNIASNHIKRQWPSRDGGIWLSCESRTLAALLLASQAPCIPWKRRATLGLQTAGLPMAGRRAAWEGKHETIKPSLEVTILRGA